MFKHVFKFFFNLRALLNDAEFTGPLAGIACQRARLGEKLRGLIDETIGLVFHQGIDQKLRRLAAAQV